MELDPLDEDDPEAFDVKMALDAKEKRGVLFAVITIVVCAAILFFLALPADVKMLPPDYSVLGKLQSATSEWWKKNIAGA